uniref:COX assembly mitochondrial protein n=1 Tax=Acrobeloides nanus TaxID=290746 RepID=A0A914CPL4_9BILA
MNTDVLDPSLHSKECNYLRYLYDKCKSYHPFGSILYDKCGYWWIALCDCTKQERLYRRDLGSPSKNPSNYRKHERPVRLPKDRYTPALQRLDIAGYLKHLDIQPQDRFYYPPKEDNKNPMPWYKAVGPKPEKSPKYID